MWVVPCSFWPDIQYCMNQRKQVVTHTATSTSTLLDRGGSSPQLNPQMNELCTLFRQGLSLSIGSARGG